MPPIGSTPPGIERADLRSANARAFEQPDGRLIYEIFSAPVHFRPEGSTDWQPIDLRFGAAARDGASASVSASPARISLFPADHPQGVPRQDSWTLSA